MISSENASVILISLDLALPLLALVIVVGALRLAFRTTAAEQEVADEVLLAALGDSVAAAPEARAIWPPARTAEDVGTHRRVPA